MNAPLFPTDLARSLVGRALAEDHGAGGDITTRTITPRGARARGLVVARAPFVVAGLPLVELAAQGMAAHGGGPVVVELRAVDGARVEPHATLARLAGDAWSILGAERVLLNFIARLSGIATLTAECVAEVARSRCTIADTRKTTPGLRALEKYAVAVGGGENHRPTLDSMVLVKDNHKLLAGGAAPALAKLRDAGVDLSCVEFEVDDLVEFDVALAAGVGWILLDNFTPEMVRTAAQRSGGRARLEVSGGLAPGRLRAFAEAGVDRLSIGLLTHGARAVDVALDLVGEGPWPD
jgi:nicotinate-nucleotide pyrophosphorylase (carboxylating)